MLHIGENRTSLDIAKTLGITPRTVHAYRSEIRHRLGIKTNARMIRLAGDFTAAWKVGRSSAPGTTESTVPARSGARVVDSIPRLALLTTRDIQVLLGISEDHTNVEIGRRLGISDRTVHAYRTQIRASFGFTTNAELIRLADDIAKAWRRGRVVTKSSGTTDNCKP